MSEAEWLACYNLQRMLECLRDEVSERKLRLFTCACRRQTAFSHRGMFQGWREDLLKAIDQVEQYVDGIQPHLPSGMRAGLHHARQCVKHIHKYLDHRLGVPRPLQAALVRDIFGNPFRPVTVDPFWLTRNVVGLAQAIYDERRFRELPILADALEGAGCTDADILDHCRLPGEHVRGCWVIDLLLGKA